LANSEKQFPGRIYRRKRMATHKDPVCGMQIEESEAAGQTDYEGTTYYFCSTSCIDKFEKDPENYTSQ
jgi:Cu+-exporting ATPase